MVNSLYHRDYAQHEPVEITIESEGISILNCPGPDRSIPMSAIEKGDILKSRRYRNRRLGDFLKELDLTEGRSTGVPTIQEKLADNGSLRATFETTEDRLTFLIHIPIHAGCGNKPATEKTTEKIVRLMKANPYITNKELAEVCGITEDGVYWNTKKLKKNNRIRRIGGDKGGYWEVIENGTHNGTPIFLEKPLPFRGKCVSLQSLIMWLYETLDVKFMQGDEVAYCAHKGSDTI